MDSVEIRDSSRIRLHPLRIAPFGDGHYSVIRRGGRTEIATRELGIEALERLRAGASVGETRRCLAERHGTRPEAIRLEPLLKSLRSAGLIAAVDGVSLHTPGVRLSDRLRFQLRFEILPRAARATQRLPLPVARIALRRIFGRLLAGPCRRKVTRAGASYEAIVPGVGPQERERFEREYFDHLVWNVVDPEALRRRPLGQVDRWLEEHVELDRIDVFDRASREGRGVLLSGFHFASNRLLPVALMRRGYSLLSMGAISIGWGAQSTRDQLASWSGQRPSWGEVELVDNLDLGSVNRLVGALRAGGTVLTMPDVYSLSTFEDALVAERARFFGIVRSRFPRASVPVRFFGHRIQVSPWGGWLASVARPVVLPISMERRRDRLVCRFGDPIEAPGPDGSGDRVARMTEAIFERLGSEVAAKPSQWFGWHNLDKLDPRPVAATGPIPSPIPTLGSDPSVAPKTRVGRR